MDLAAPPVRPCNRCGSVLPRTPEHWYRTKKRADGLSANCKVCERKQLAGVSAKKRERDRALKAGQPLPPPPPPKPRAKPPGDPEFWRYGGMAPKPPKDLAHDLRGDLLEAISANWDNIKKFIAKEAAHDRGMAKMVTEFVFEQNSTGKLAAIVRSVAQAHHDEALRERAQLRRPDASAESDRLPPDGAGTDGDSPDVGLAEPASAEDVGVGGPAER